MAHTKMSINISEEARDFLEECKTKRSTDFTTTVHRALGALKYVYEVERSGEDLYVRRSDGTYEKIRCMW